MSESTISDLIVIGAGSGGVRAARIAAGLGAKVKVIESSDLGGTCVNLGCVPKKLFVYASQYPGYFSEAQGFGWSKTAPTFDWTTLRKQKNKEILRLNGIYNNLLDNSGVEIIRGHARFISANSIQVGEQTHEAKHILIATGSKPFIPDIPGKEHIWSSNEMFHLDQLPKKLVIVGGGYIAVEFASIMHGLGVETSLLYRGELFLRGFDEECRRNLAEEMIRKGIDLRFNCQVNAIEEKGTNKVVLLEDGNTIECQGIMYATGRSANTSGLDLDKAGVKLNDKGGIKVDDQFRTNVTSIFALGDVIDRVQLTPVAIQEGMWLTRFLFEEGFDALPPQYDLIPTAIFSQPNIGTVGLSEEEAIEKFKNVDVYVSNFKALKNTLSGNEERTTMKLIVHADDDRILGAHMLGPDAGEIVQGLAVAMRANATKKDFDQTIGIHPTSAEEFVTMRNVSRQHRN